MKIFKKYVFQYHGACFPRRRQQHEWRRVSNICCCWTQQRVRWGKFKMLNVNFVGKWIRVSILQNDIVPVNYFFHVGRPNTIVNGKINMHISTQGELVKSLMPVKDHASLVRVLAELTQNVMDWAFHEDKSVRVPFGVTGF